MHSIVLLAQTTVEQTPTPSALPGWVYVVASAAVSALVTILSGKVVVPTFAYARERDRGDRLEAEKNAEIAKRDAQIAALQSRVIDEFTPMIVRATDVIDDLRRQNERLRTRKP